MSQQRNITQSRITEMSTESETATDSDILQPKRRKSICSITDNHEIRDPKGRKVKSSCTQTETGTNERDRAFFNETIVK